MMSVVAVLAVAVAAGAVVQGSIGFGYALVAVPAMVLLFPWAVPVTPLLLALPMTLLMSAREWRSIDLGGFALITGGRLVGTVAGVAEGLSLGAHWAADPGGGAREFLQAGL